jgi:hypothetical protein
MDELTESIVGNLQSRGIPVDKILLAHGIEGLKCEYPTLLETLAGDDDTIFVKIFDMVQVAVASGEAIEARPAAESTQAAAITVQDRPTPSAPEPATSLRSAIENAQQEVERLADPANVRLPRLEDQGYSWSLTL